MSEAISLVSRNWISSELSGLLPVIIGALNPSHMMAIDADADAKSVTHVPMAPRVGLVSLAVFTTLSSTNASCISAVARMAQPVMIEWRQGSARPMRANATHIPPAVPSAVISDPPKRTSAQYGTVMSNHAMNMHAMWRFRNANT